VLQLRMLGRKKGTRGAAGGGWVLAPRITVDGVGMPGSLPEHSQDGCQSGTVHMLSRVGSMTLHDNTLLRR